MATERIVLLSPEQVAVFWAKIHAGDIWDCWPWQGYLNEDGYGRWTVRLGKGQRATFYAHRLAYALAIGPIPAGKEAAHSILCTTRACCNPDHLTPKSHWENLQDIVTRKALGLNIQSASADD